MARFDKYDPISGGFRAPLASAYTGSSTPIGVGLNSSGRVVPGAGQTGILGVIVQPADKAALSIVDVMDGGEIVEFAGAAGTVYCADTTTGVITATAPSATKTKVGHTVEATRLVVRTAGLNIPATAVVGDQAAIVHLTNNTGQAGDNTIDNVPAVAAAAGEATAADLTETNARLQTLEGNDASLAAKIEELQDMVEAAGLVTP